MDTQRASIRIGLPAVITLMIIGTYAQKTVAQNTFPTPTGNVGIGTTSPTQKLEVSGGPIKITGGGLFLDDDHAIRAGGGNQSLVYRSSSNGIYYGSGDANDFLVLNAGGSERFRIATSGKVGIGTTTPNDTLQVGETGNFGIQIGKTWGVGIKSVFVGGIGSRMDFVEYANSDSGVTRMSILSGNVGIGNDSPQFKLDVNGTINSNSTITANNIVAKYQDVAEWVPSSEQLAAGTVVVLDSTKSNQVISSIQSYDTRVAGVISAQPGIALGEKGDGKVLVATTGRVKIKVDATRSAIHIGDLLVTSDVPGVAMKSEPIELAGRKMHMPGTLIGKALEPLEKGRGEILVLLSLQ